MANPINSPHRYYYKAFISFLIFAFIFSGLPPIPVEAGVETPLASPSGGLMASLRLPAPGVMVHLSPEFNPPMLKGIKVHADNPFRFDFILDKGDFVETPLMASVHLRKYIRNTFRHSKKASTTTSKKILTKTPNKPFPANISRVGFLIF